MIVEYFPYFDNNFSALFLIDFASILERYLSVLKRKIEDDCKEEKQLLSPFRNQETMNFY